MKSMAVLLGASILLNIVLLVRRPTTPERAPARPVPSPRAGEAAGPAPDPTADTPEVQALRARLRELESQQRVQREPDEEPDPLSSFRERTARALKLLKDPKALAAADPEARLDQSEVTVTFERARLERWKDPRAYTRRLEVVLEEVAAESKTPFGVYEKARIRTLLEEYEAALSGMADKDSIERYLQETGPEADVLQRLRAFITPEQAQKMMMLGTFGAWNASAAPWVDPRQAEPQLVHAWMSAYGLDESQRSQAAAAARVYINAAEALNAQMGRDALPGRESPEWRRRTAHVLVDALSALEPALTPEQRDRLRGRRPAEVRVYDPTALQRLSR